MNFANAYTLKEERDDFRTVNNEPSMTQQADRMDTDINVIMARYEKTGQLPRILTQPLYGDFTNVPTYRESVERIQAADAAFMEIPAKIRAEFDNDPQKFIEFATNPENTEQLTKWGLTKPKPEPTIAERQLAALEALKPKETPPNG